MFCYLFLQETRPPRSQAQDADDEALRRAIEESSQDAMQPKSKSALELADEEALKKAIELSMKEANTGVSSLLSGSPLNS